MNGPGHEVVAVAVEGWWPEAGVQGKRSLVRSQHGHVGVAVVVGESRT